jgi:hypothetical protein
MVQKVDHFTFGLFTILNVEVDQDNVVALNKTAIA